jgi:nucleotide-binding universal stress UspA family protein
MATINRILCPIDFSDFSREALKRAIAVAKDHRSAVTMLYVAPLPSPAFVPGVEWNPPVPLRPDERAALMRSATEFLADVASPEVAVDIEISEAPTIAGEILGQAARLRADLIVMGTHGRGGFQRLVFGSVAERVLRLAPQPVMTVGLGGTGSAPAAGAFGRIVCGVDFSDCSLAALHYALALAEGAMAHITVVNVLEWAPSGYDPLAGFTDIAGVRAAVERSAHERLHALVAGLPPSGIQITTSLRSGKPHREILSVAAEQDADLIVLGIHGRNPLDRLFFGSTAEPVVRRASCPVLTVRAAATAHIAAA